MIGSAYQAAAIAAVIGPAHAATIPDTLWGAWLDASDVVLSDTDVQVPHAAFDTSGTGVVNIVEVDGGTLPTGAAKFAITDAALGGEVIVAVPVATTASPGDAVVFMPGDLTITYEAPA